MLCLMSQTSCFAKSIMSPLHKTNMATRREFGQNTATFGDTKKTLNSTLVEQVLINSQSAVLGRVIQNKHIRCWQMYGV